MNKLIYILFVLALFSGCTTDFEKINTNENAPIDVQPSLLLRKVIWDYAENMHYEGFVSGGLLSQHLTAVDFNLFDRHSLLEPQFGGNPWPFMYKNLRDIEIVLDKSKSEETFAVYEGPARLLKAYITMALTDMFGDIPYSEALNGKEGNITPSYDRQEEIYLGESGIIKNIEAGIAAVRDYSGNTPLEGDILYSGQLDQWKKFGYSMLLKANMRISNVQVNEGIISQIYEVEDFISSPEDDAIFSFTDTEPNNYRMATARIGDFNVYIMSKTLEEILKSYNDPRIATFFRPTQNDPSDYKGLRNGPDASQTTISIADYSLAGEIFRESTGQLKANYMTSWETKFLLAEAAHKGWINADAKSLYEEAVNEAFLYWGVDLPSGYFEGGADYDSGDGLEKIITQKWIASMINGFEGWIEYRRTGFPALKTVSASLNNDLIPVRMPYPTDEAALNTVSFEAASNATDGNSINFPVWWD